MKAIITVGVSASGKSTWAKEYAMANGFIITNRDDLRFSLTGCTGWEDYRFTKDVEDLVSQLQREIVVKSSNLGRDIIICDTNLRRKYREQWVSLCTFLGYDVEVMPFHISQREANERDSLRDNVVGEDVIAAQWELWLEYLDELKGNR